MNYLWLDLETTGLDPYTDNILECAIQITGPDLEPQRVMEWLVPMRNPRWHDRLEHPAYMMHSESGLIDDLEDEAQWLNHYRLDEVEAGILARIEPFLVDGKITLAGSGVATFDLAFIKEQMPDLAARLNYWTLDIGVVRRFLRDVCGVNLIELGPVKHRAASDVQHHLREARAYQGAISAAMKDVGQFWAHT